MQSECPPAIVFTAIDNLPLAIDDGHRRLPSVLAALASERIVPIFCSSRTRAEVEGFRQSIGIFHPFVCEHGAAVFLPKGYFGTAPRHARAVGGYEALEFGLPYERVVERVRRIAAQYRLEIRGFADMSIEQVAAECGLSLLEARFAKLREYAEPFRLLRTDRIAERRMQSALESAGLTCAAHGAFLHASSVGSHGPAAAALVSLYKGTFGRVLTAAAGGEGIDDVMARADVRIDTRAASGETLAWIEHIVDRIRSVRALAASTPSRVHATAGPTPASLP